MTTGAQGAHHDQHRELGKHCPAADPRALMQLRGYGG
jgi:hypothetical protein